MPIFRRSRPEPRTPLNPRVLAGAPTTASPPTTNSPPATAPPPTTASRFEIGDKVRLKDHFAVFPVRSVGEVLSPAPGSKGLAVQFGNGQPVDVPESYLESVPALPPHVFELGTRVRLTDEFDGFIRDGERVALERPGEHGGLHFDPGELVGTVVHHAEGGEDFRVQLDPDPFAPLEPLYSIVVSGRKLEAIPGCATVTVDARGVAHVRQYYGYLDAVATLAPGIMYDGYRLPQGAVGAVRPMSPSSPIVQEMQESWETGNYWVYFRCADGEPRWQQFPTHLIRHSSDFPERDRDA